MSELITILILLLVIGICLYLFDRYITPVIPAPWGRLVEAVLVLIIIIYLVNRFVGPL